MSNVSFESNTATSYGGAVAIGLAHILYQANESFRGHNVHLIDNIANRGTAVAWLVTPPEFIDAKFFGPLCVNCTYLTNGRRVQSNLEVTVAANSLKVDCPSTIGPGVPFVCAVVVLDLFDNVVSDSDGSVTTGMEGPNCTFATSLSQRLVRDGYANFPSTLRAPIGNDCTLQFQLQRDTDLELTKNVTVRLVTCPPMRKLENGICEDCPLDTYSLGGTTYCLDCLDNMICGTTIEVVSGYYPTRGEQGQLVIQKCVFETCCPDADSCTFDIATTPNAAWAACGPGFGGPLCSECLSGRVHWGGTCVDCSTVQWGYGILLFFITFLVACYFVLVPSKSIDRTGGILGWTTIHHKFVSRVLIFQTLAPLLREHDGWSFLRAVEVASLNMDLGPQVCMGDFSPIGRVVSVVLFPLLLFPLCLLLAAVASSRCSNKKIPSTKELMLSISVLCVQPCLRSAAPLVSCITVGTEFVMASTGVRCYEGAHIAAAVFSWLFLGLLAIFALVGLASRLKAELIVFLPEDNLLNRIIAHSIVTIIAGADGDARDTGVAFITLVLGFGIYFQGLDNNFPAFWLQTGGWLCLILIAILEYLAAEDASVRQPCLAVITALVVIGAVEAFVAIGKQLLGWKGKGTIASLSAKEAP